METSPMIRALSTLMSVCLQFKWVSNVICVWRILCLDVCVFILWKRECLGCT